MPKPNGGWKHDKRSRHERGYGTAWDKLRPVILTRDKHLCQPCLKEGRITPAHTVDHITPKAQGGTDNPGNLQAICVPCHTAKTEREAAEAQGRRQRPRYDERGWPVWE
ncbi:HNH endonuclease [Pseudogemmobacter sonorensis]|uniref:HNH endonuclease n=1 Tax=Pseudogemmobacter sonorensis TaxID=2989681 RepID=UPI0036A393FB